MLKWLHHVIFEPLTAQEQISLAAMCFVVAFPIALIWAIFERWREQKQTRLRAGGFRKFKQKSSGR